MGKLMHAGKVFTEVRAGGGGADTFPKFIYTNSANRRSLATFTHTFTESGTFQYYFLIRSASTVTSSSGTITLNSTTITPTFDNTTAATMGFFYGEVEVDVGDVLEFKTVSTESHMGTQVFILQNADITAFSCVGVTTNDNSSFAINLDDKPYLQVYQCGYYNTNNIYHYEIGRYGTTSIAVPGSYAPCYYGFTYVLTIV